MARPNSIEGRGLAAHIESWCVQKELNVGFSDFDKWLRYGDEFGDPVAVSKFMKKFKASRPTVEKWIRIYRSARITAE